MSGELTEEVLDGLRAYRDGASPVERTPNDLRAQVAAAVAEIDRQRHVIQELRQAYASAVRKLGSLPTGWATDVDVRPDLAFGLPVDELRRIQIDAEDWQDIYGIPQRDDFTDMCDERGVVRRLAGDVLTLLKAMGVEVEDARDE